MHNVVMTLADMMTREGTGWRTQAAQADARAKKLGGQRITLDFDNGPHVATIDFLGYAYTRRLSDISGAVATYYDATKPQVWHIPLRDTIIAKVTVKAPAGGYIVPAADAGWMAEKLILHGIRFRRLDASDAPEPVETFRATKVTYGGSEATEGHTTPTFEGHTMVSLEGSWAPDKRSFPAGSLFVPIAQPNARLVVALLEPQAVDSLASWGFFNTAFEAKEYMEPYVEEQVASNMLAHDPEIAADFKKRLAGDPRFARDPGARLDYFYRHSPSWDERLNLYPVYRVTAEPSRRVLFITQPEPASAR
jgi:hypothetical protein